MLKRCALPAAILVGVLALLPAGLIFAATPSPQMAPVQLANEVKGTPPEKPASPLSLPAHLRYTPPAFLGQGYANETEPNGTTATASPLAGTNLVVRANLFPNGDIDFYSFTANAGDRIYAATMTSFTATSASSDSQLTLLASDGTTTIEFDDDNGTFAGLSSSIANATIPTTGTYFLKVNDFTAGTANERPYELHLRIQSGSPTPETEPNDTPATANVLPANGWVSGARNPAVATEQDWYSLALNAGDTVYLSLDVDPERDAVVWNGRLGVALFGDASNQILVIDDTGTGDVTPFPNIPSEALFMTVKTAGTYFAFVDSASAAVGGPTATYTLSVSVHPAANEGVNCTTYTSTDVPKTIGPGTGLVSSTITVPGNPRIADVDVDLVLNHALMADIDAHLRSPAGNDNGLFTDIGFTTTGGQTQMDTVFDDEAGIPAGSFTVLKGLQIKPELNYRLSWFDGENAGGTWTLDLRDDTAGANGGTLTSWSLRICEAPPVPACPTGFTPQTVFSTDFEGGAAGFTHSGTQDEWELGLPATLATTTANPVAAFSNCNSGTSCWKTDLDNTYNASSTQDLLSPNINLATLVPPVVVTWAQRYQMETSTFDHMNIDARQVSVPANAVRLFEWLDSTMVDAPGNPTVNIGASSGWSVLSRRADSLAGLNTELNFHLDSETSVNFGGLAIDDVSVRACRALSADLSITKTDGVTTAVPGGSVTYTITASNAGIDPVNPATVADTFPASLTCTWTCVGAGGGACAASGSGNINDATVNLPVGGSVTYTASCAISAAATGTLSNTSTVSSSITDPVPGNNTATDSDTLAPQANLGITKTDGVTTAVPGQSVTYTITASNPGPSNSGGATVADTFPAACTSVTWTCAGAGGASCAAASGSGNINATVTPFPVGGSVTYSATCNISATATGTLANTATVTAPAGVTDPTPGNNSASDSDTLSPQANLGITKTDGVTSVTPGNSTTYTITASNPGPSASPGATVADTFPAACTSVTWTCAGAGGASCAAASGSGNISATVTPFPVGGSVTYSAICTTNAAATGSLINTATVAAPAGVTDPTPGNNSATDTDALAQQADLGITKTDGVTTVIPGQPVTYTIVANNAGPSGANGATVADTFPASCASVAWTCASAGGASCAAASGSGNISATVTPFPSGGSVTYSATCTTSAAATGSLANTATVTAPGSVTDPTPGNNSATDTDSFSLQANLGITKTDGVTTAVPGQSVTYTIAASNAGPSAAPGSTVADTFPAFCTSVSWTCAGTGGASCTASGSGNINDSANLPNGGTATYTAMCNISAAATGTLVNTATVTAPGSVTDPTPGNNTATDTDTLGAQADLSITKTDGQTDALPGDPVTYTIVATNAGPSNVTGATVADTFPGSLTGVTWTCVGSGGGTCTASGSGNINDTANLPSGATVTYTANATIGAAFTGTITNTATVTAPAGTTDPNPANNSATDTTNVASPSAISGTKEAAGDFVVGGTITYTIVLTNNGSSVQLDNPGDELVDVLPPELELVSATATSGTAVATVGTNTVTWNGTIPVSGSVTITITATIANDAGGATISNQAQINYDGDGNGTNESQAFTDDPATGGGGDPTVFGVPPGTQAIPTLSTLGLGVMITLLAFAALVISRRRSRA